MGIGISTTIQNPMSIGIDMDMTFENEYEYGYSSTRFEPTLYLSLATKDRVANQGKYPNSIQEKGFFAFLVFVFFPLLLRIPDFVF